MVTIISKEGATEIMERISAEMGMFLNDLEYLTDNEIKKLQAFAFLTCQLKRFSREELKYFDQYCNEMLMVRWTENCGKSLGDMVITDDEKDSDLNDIYKRLHDQFYKDSKPTNPPASTPGATK